MSNYVRVFWSGAVISFTGSLPPGITNIAATQIAISQGVWPALLFSVGSALAEAIYVRIALKAISWLRKNEKVMRAMEVITIVVLLLLAFASFKAALSNGRGKNFFIESSLPPIILGFIISMVSPKQVIFWFGVTTMMYESGKLESTTGFHNTFNFGVIAGTLLANILYIFGGYYFADFIKKYEPAMNGAVGVIFLILAIVRLVQYFKKKNKLPEPAYGKRNYNNDAAA